MTNEKWHAEIAIDEKIVKACIEMQFKELLPLVSLRCIGEGWDNKVFLVNGDIIFRFPRRKVSINLLEQENNVLKALQSRLNLEIPNPCYIGKASDYYPFAFHGYKMIKGISGCHANLSEQQRIESIGKLALFLKNLHSIDVVTAKAMGALPPAYDRLTFQKLKTALQERIDKIIAKNLCNLDKTILEQEISLAEKIKLSDNELCLVHGDLYCRHLMFNEGKLTGIIDWGDMGLNHKAIDLSVIWSFYPAQCYQQFFDIYGPVDSNAWSYARFIAIYSSITLVLYGHDVNDALLVSEVKHALKRINPAIFQNK